MGFTDLLSSGRGPGVIGTLVALLVLVGFGGLFMVFDKDMERAGGKKIEAVVRDLGLEIEGKQTQLASFKELVKQGDLLKEQENTIGEIKASVAQGAPKIEELKANISAAEAANKEAKAAWEEYKNQYRAQTWEKAIGRNIGDVKGVTSGKLYTNAVITKVEHIGLRVTDSTGPKRIALEDVPLSLVDELQLSKEIALVDEGQAGDDEEIHRLLAELTELGERRDAKEAFIEQLENKATDSEKSASTANTSSGEYDRLISRLQAQIRAEKGKSVSKAPQMEQELRQLKARADANRASIEPLRQAAREARAAIPQARTDLRKLEDDFAAKNKEIEAKRAAKKAATPAPTE